MASRIFNSLRVSLLILFEIILKNDPDYVLVYI